MLIQKSFENMENIKYRVPSNKFKLHTLINKDKIKSKDVCHHFVFHSAVQKYNNWSIKKYNFASLFFMGKNLVL